MSAPSPLKHSTIAIILIVWFFAAIAAGASGAMAALRPPLPQLVLLGLTGVILTLFAKSERFHVWAMTVDIRGLIGVHVTRFVGLYFLHLNVTGRLPYAFALPAGCGDTAIAFLALGAIGLGKQLGKRAPSIYLGWNLIGLIEILFVVATAARLGISNPASMSPLIHLPLSLLPSFLVPIIIATHVIIFVRLVREDRAASNPQ